MGHRDQPVSALRRNQLKPLMTKHTKQQIIETLLENCEKSHRERMELDRYHSVNDNSWTIADLFIRQWLNNGSDGFGMNNVRKMYAYLVDCKTELIQYNLLSKDGKNNSGWPLWNHYVIEGFEHL
jgi:hypothetical protein